MQMAFKFYTYPHYLIAFTYNTRGSGKLNGETSLLLKAKVMYNKKTFFIIFLFKDFY
jgi:aromatic ring-opening dioxygenase catalytic subunit (LigB family)